MQNLAQREEFLAQEENSWKKEKEIFLREQALKQDKKATKKTKKKIPTSKKLVWFLFINCTLIEVIVILVTFQMLNFVPLLGILPDFTPLVTLVGTIVSEVIGYAVYAVKSAKENSIGGITYDMAMRDLDMPSENSNNDSGSAVG